MDHHSHSFRPFFFFFPPLVKRICLFEMCTKQYIGVGKCVGVCGGGGGGVGGGGGGSTRVRIYGLMSSSFFCIRQSKLRYLATLCVYDTRKNQNWEARASSVRPVPTSTLYWL